MHSIRWIVKAASLLAGAVLAASGAILLTAVASGDARVGAAAVSFVGISFLAVSAPCLAYPFWPRFAVALLALDLAGFSFAMLWLAFVADGPSAESRIFQAAAGAFCVILMLRFRLAYRRGMNAHNA